MTKPKYPKSTQERAKVYLHCMAEIKERLRLVNLTKNQPSQILFINEICYLQLRYICELIAIACLTAQGDFKTQRAFTQEYSPPKIFAALREIYPKFFPAASETITTGNRHHIKFAHRPEAYDEADISALWNQAGAHLHRSSVNQYLTKTFGSPPNLQSIDAHLKGIIGLLECHILPIQTTLSHTVLLQVVLDNGDNDCAATFFNRDEQTGEVWLEGFKTSLVQRT